LISLKIVGAFVMLVGFAGFVLSILLDIDARIALFLSSAAAVLTGYGFMRLDVILSRMLADKASTK